MVTLWSMAKTPKPKKVAVKIPIDFEQAISAEEIRTKRRAAAIRDYVLRKARQEFLPLPAEVVEVLPQ